MTGVIGVKTSPCSCISEVCPPMLPPYTALLPPCTAGAGALQTSWPGSHHSPGVILQHLPFHHSQVLRPYLTGGCHPNSQLKGFQAASSTSSPPQVSSCCLHQLAQEVWQQGRPLWAPPFLGPFRKQPPTSLPSWPYSCLGQVGSPKTYEWPAGSEHLGCPRFKGQAFGW